MLLYFNLLTYNYPNFNILTHVKEYKPTRYALHVHFTHKFHSLITYLVQDHGLFDSWILRKLGRYWGNVAGRAFILFCMISRYSMDLRWYMERSYLRMTFVTECEFCMFRVLSCGLSGRRAPFILTLLSRLSANKCDIRNDRLKAWQISLTDPTLH